MTVSTFTIPLRAGGALTLATHPSGTVRVRLEAEGKGGREVAEGTMQAHELHALSTVAQAAAEAVERMGAGGQPPAGCSLGEHGPAHCAAMRCQCAALAWGA